MKQHKQLKNLQGRCRSIYYVTPCWCYGSETLDMDPLTPKLYGFMAQNVQEQYIWQLH